MAIILNDPDLDQARGPELRQAVPPLRPAAPPLSRATRGDVLSIANDDENRRAAPPGLTLIRLPRSRADVNRALSP